MPPDTRASQQQSPEHITRMYYRLVDQHRLDEFLGLFHEAIHYERQGTPLIQGRSALRHFYERDRVIAGGQHHIEHVLTDGAWIAVRGRFEGTLHDGESVAIRFTDWLHFRDGLIDHRETLFPDRPL